MVRSKGVLEKPFNNSNVSKKFFEKGFIAFTGKEPFKWQTRLFIDCINGNLPDRIELPTGSGKTSLMQIWLLAYSWTKISDIKGVFPRRLVWIVDRRVVVDQATKEAENIRNILKAQQDIENGSSSDVVQQVLDVITNTCIKPLAKEPLAISTLRGELTDNREWKKDPSKLAIVIGTVDMIGSRLLFSGYGDGSYYRPYHAALLGIDSLIVIDEAHLSPALVKTVKQVEVLASKKHAFTPMKLIELTATPRGESDNVFKLNEDDKTSINNNEVFIRRLYADKRLRFHEIDVSPKLKPGKNEIEAMANKITDIANQEVKKGEKIVIYVKAPKLAIDITKKLAKEFNVENIKLLIGTIRGYERDQMVQSKVFKSFLINSSEKERGEDETRFLVMTSAGEVGINLDADRIICDLVPGESFIQRLGRLNRFGFNSMAMVHLVHFNINKAKKADYKKLCQRPEWQLYFYLKGSMEAEKLDCDEMESSEKTSSNIVQQYKSDRVSPLRFIDDPLPENTMSEIPWSPTVDVSHLDQWAMTSIKDRNWPDRRPVQPFLHGLRDNIPETHIVWRNEVGLLANANLSQKELREHYKSFRILSHEKLKCYTYNLEELFKGIKKKPDKDTKKEELRARDLSLIPVVIRFSDGSVDLKTLKEIEDEYQKPNGLSFLSYATLIVDTSYGKLSKDGILDNTIKKKTFDVSLKRNGKNRKQFLLINDTNGWGFRSLSQNNLEPIIIPGLESKNQKGDLGDIIRFLEKKENGRVISLLNLMKKGAEDQEDQDINKEEWLICFTVKKRSKDLGFDQSLEDHQKAVQSIVKQLCSKLNLGEELCNTFEISAKHHDDGKNRQFWQEAIGNLSPDKPLGKSVFRKLFRQDLTAGYRHEFGSLLELSQQTDEVDMELLRHLIAAHHKSGRPGFEKKAFDRGYSFKKNSELRFEVMERFVTLQKKFGWWGLAFLETIFKAADGIASSGYMEGSTDYEE